MLLVMLSFFFVSCSTRHEYMENEVKTVDLADLTKLVLHNNDGNVLIKGLEGASDIRVEVTKRVSSRLSVSDARRHVSDITVSTREKNGTVEISATHPRTFLRRHKVDLSILLPHSFDGDINVVNGDLTLVSSSRFVTINVGNGNIVADVALQDSCSVYIGVGNGKIDLSIPSGTNASLSTLVGTGVISTAGLLIQNQQKSKDRLSGILGSGAGSIRLLTGNGDIEINTLQ